MNTALKNRLVPHFSLNDLLVAGYYRFLFGRDLPLAVEVRAKIAALEKQQRRGDIPIAKEVWEAQYAGAKWAYLADLEEQTRYDVIAGYIQLLKPGGSILDVGCGNGLLLGNLKVGDYSRYAGIDISQTAIDQAAASAHSRAWFMQADAQTYVPAERFDVIVFNEVLYYLNNPLREVERYESALNRHGLFITSLYGKSVRAVGISRWLKRRYSTLVDLKVTATSGAWIIDAFEAQSSFAEPDLPGGAQRDVMS